MSNENYFIWELSFGFDEDLLLDRGKICVFWELRSTGRIKTVLYQVRRITSVLPIRWASDLCEVSVF